MGFLLPVYCLIVKESAILQLNGTMRVKENPYSGILGGVR